MNNGQMSLIEELRHAFEHGNMVIKLILINVGVYCAISLAYLLFFLLQLLDGYDVLLNKLMVPADLQNLLWQPWSLITYMFLHEKLLHLLFNMITLNLFGNILSDFLGNTRILAIYVLGGLVGALFYILIFHTFPAFRAEIDVSYMLGASAGVMSIMLAAATLRPDYSISLVFIGPVKIKWIALFLVLIDLFAVAKSNPGGHIAHLGGAAMGYFLIKQLNEGKDWASYFNNFMTRLISLFYRQTSSKPRIIYKRQDAAPKNMTPHQSSVGASVGASNKGSSRGKLRQDQQDRIDAILDKISKSGYDSLSKEEKDYLFRVSNDNE